MRELILQVFIYTDITCWFDLCKDKPDSQEGGGVRHVDSTLTHTCLNEQVAPLSAL